MATSSHMFSTRWYLHYAKALRWNDVPPYQNPQLNTGAVVPAGPFVTPVLAIEAHTYEVDAFSREMLEKRMKLVELMDQNKQPKEEVDQDSDGIICAEGRVSSATTVDIKMAELTFGTVQSEQVEADTSSTEPLHHCFGSLPLELVGRIGELAVLNPEPIELFYPSSKEYSNIPAVLAQPAITRVNKFFRKALLPAFYEKNCFVVHDDWLDMILVSDWLRAIGLVNRCRLRWLFFTSECEDLGRVVYRMTLGRGPREVFTMPMPETAQVLGLDLGFFPDAADATVVLRVGFKAPERIDLAERASVARVEGPRVKRSISVGAWR